MEIECLSVCKRKLPSGAEQTYKAGWSGDVPDADALHFIAEGRARPTIGAVEGFTADETLALKLVAQHTLAAAMEVAEAADEGAANGDGDADGEDAVEDADDDFQDPAAAIRALAYEDLRVLATERGVKHVGRKRVDVETDLIRQIDEAAG